MRGPAPNEPQQTLVAPTDEAESMLLCSLMAKNGLFEYCADLREEHFSEPGYGRLFAAMAEKIKAGYPASPSTLQSWAERAGFAFDVLVNMHQSGMAYGVRVSDLAATIRAGATQRGLVHVLETSLKSLREQPLADVSEMIVRLEKKLGHIARDGSEGDSFRDLHVIMEKAIADAKAGRSKGLSTGIKALDDLTGGIAAGHFWAIGGYAKQGKSTISQHIGTAVALQKKAVLRFDFEMTDDDVGLRHATSIAYNPERPAYAGVARNPTYIAARRAILDAEQWGWLEEAAAMAVDLPIYVTTERGLTVAQMTARARRKIRMLERQGIETGLIIVDHSLLVAPEVQRRGNKAAETGDVINEITEMAKTLNVGVAGLCQMNRDAAKSEGRPVKSQLAWSSAIEQNANVIALIHRPASKLEAKEKLSFDEADELDRVKDHLALYVDGNRNGPTGEVWCRTNMGSAIIKEAPDLARKYHQ